MAASGAQIPVFLLTGFLGAGKTTLLNRLLSDPAFGDTALVINEFGLVPVDHDLVRQGREQPVVTTTGCICCTAGSDLRSSLDELLIARREGNIPAFSRVIVETTGLADPAPIINSLIPGGLPAVALRDHAVARAFALSGVVCMVNVEGIGEALDAHPESLRQIAFADHVVLSRTDLQPAGDWPETLRSINPALRIHDSAAADFDPSALFTPGSYSAFGKGGDVMAWLKAETDQGHAHAHDFSDLNRHGAVEAVPLVYEGVVEEAALRRFLLRLTSEGQGFVKAADPAAADPSAGVLLRIKGLVALADDPATPAVVHAVQHRLYPMGRLEAWPDGRAETRLVLIGSGLDVPAIRREWARITGQVPAAPFAQAMPNASPKLPFDFTSGG